MDLMPPMPARRPIWRSPIPAIARHPAPARAAGAALEQRLRQASVAFDMLDLEVATPQELARYALIILPGALALAPATQQQLAQCVNIVLLSDQADASAFDIGG